MPPGLSVFCMNVFVNYARGKKHESYSLLKVNKGELHTV